VTTEQNGDGLIFGGTRVVVEIGATEDTLGAADAGLAAEPPAASFDIRYGIIASGPAVSLDEVEVGAQAVEVIVMWGDSSVLHVAHLSPPRDFFVGEPATGKGAAKTDYLIGSELLGTERLPVVLQSAGGTAVVIPEGATGEISVGDESISFADLEALGELQPSSALSGAQQVQLAAGATATLTYKGFTFFVKPVQAGKVIGKSGSSSQWKSNIWTAVSFAVHGVFLLVMYFTPPSSASMSLELLTADSRYAKHLAEPVEQPWFFWEEPERQDYFWDATPTPEVKKERRIRLAFSSGGWNYSRRDSALGDDAITALGPVMGEQVGEDFGSTDWLFATFVDERSLFNEGSIGLRRCYDCGPSGLYGRREPVPRIRIRTGNADVRGSLSKEVIRRVIQRHINEVRFCYEKALYRNPKLEGRISVHFEISPTGAVQMATVAESDMGSPALETCIAEAVQFWSFPAPENSRTVVVNYPFVLQNR